MTATELTYENVSQELAATFPDLSAAVSAQLNLFADEPRMPQHAVLGLVFNEFVMENLRRGDDNALAKIFDFLERMSSSRDEDVQSIATTVVLERILGWGTADDQHRAEAVMGPATRRFYDWYRVRGRFRPPSR